MSLRVYNTLTKQKDLFEPVHPGKVGIYLCGVTVYKSPHIGHMVGPVIFDAIKRYLTFKGYEVTLVVNITDVDDKIIDRAAKDNTSVQAVAERYTKEYLEALAGFGVDSIDKFPKASEHIADIIELTERLIEQGHAYAAEGNVYFDVTSDSDYGKLSNRRVEEQEAGTRAVEGAGKRNPADFALWKAVKPGEPAWDSPWGKGRPGWHIECSAMSMKYLGPTFDMHGGGMDLMFPHHENEMAQSESATGQTFARFWMHNGLTRIKTKVAGAELELKKIGGTEIAKGEQEGSAVDARNLLDKHGAELLRYLLLSTHYRRPIEFTDEVIVASKKGLAVFHRLLERIERLNGAPIGDETQDMDRTAAGLLESENGHFARSILGLKMKFLEMMDDDFNTAGAIAVLHEMAGETNAFIERHNVEVNKQPDLMQAVTAATQTLRKLGLVLGLFRATPQKTGAQDKGLVDGLMALLIKLRADARGAKQFAIADGVRDGLAQLGITLEDRPDGTGWRKQ
jgi:cysteinyl-tRNA synthetase